MLGTIWPWQGRTAQRGRDLEDSFPLCVNFYFVQPPCDEQYNYKYGSLLFRKTTRLCEVLKHTRTHAHKRKKPHTQTKTQTQNYISERTDL